MKDKDREMFIERGLYILHTKKRICDVALHFGLSGSSICRSIEKLKEIDEALYAEVKEITRENAKKSRLENAYKGGYAPKRRYDRWF